VSETTRHYALFLGTPVLAGTITAPTCGGSATSAAITVSWTFAPGPQQSFTVQVFTDAALTVLAYYSGVVASATQSHVIPAGSLSNGVTYYVLVDFVNTLGQTGQAGGAACSFLTAFAPSVDVTGLTVKVQGGCADPASIPAFRLAWTQVVPGAGETFVSYYVKRREGGDTVWTRIATVTAVGTLSYVDYNVRSRAVYQYAIVWEATTAGGTLISTEVAVNGYVDFDHCWIHEVGAGTTNARFDQFEADISVIQDIQTILTWGRSAPTVQVGEKQFHQISLPGLSRHLRDRARWQGLRDMLARQRTASAVYCVRMGAARELWFCSIAGLSRKTGQMEYAPDLSLIEIEYSEAV